MNEEYYPCQVCHDHFELRDMSEMGEKQHLVCDRCAPFAVVCNECGGVFNGKDMVEMDAAGRHYAFCLECFEKIFVER